MKEKEFLLSIFFFTEADFAKLHVTAVSLRAVSKEVTAAPQVIVIHGFKF